MKTAVRKFKWLAILPLSLALSSCGSNEGTSSSASTLGSAASISSSSSSYSSVSSSFSSSSPSSSSSIVASSSSASSAEPPLAQPVASAVSQSVVRFIYFIEQGETFDQRRYDGLVEAAFDLQQYWYEQFGGTFYLYDNIVDVMYGDNTSDYYVNTPDGFHSDQRWYRLGNMKREVFGKLNIRDFDSKVRTITYPSSRVDGRVAENWGGAWMDGDDMGCFAGENGGVTFPFDEEYFAHCLGQTAHEFGHAFGLGHEGPEDDCMQFGFYDYTTHGAMCQFSSANRSKVKNSSANQAFLSASPGQVVTRQGFVESR